MIIERYAIGDVLRVRIANNLPVWDVKVLSFNETDLFNIRLNIEAISKDGVKSPFSQAILDRDEQVLGFVSHGDIPYPNVYKAKYLELVEALKIIKKHVG